MNRIILFIFFLFACALLFAFGGKEKDVPKARVTGVVRLVGSAPMSEVVISGEEHVWYIAREEMNKLHEFQHRTVTVEGEETVNEMRFSNGVSAGTRRELRNIKIITVE